MIFFFVKKFQIFLLLSLSYVALQISNMNIFQNRILPFALLTIIFLTVFI